MKEANNYEVSNILAAQEWRCQCSDRAVSCISSDRIGFFELYEYRKQFRTEGKSSGRGGGYRDSFRRRIAEHFSQEEKSFSRSFVIGKRNDCC
eukprot:6188381-Pleurochrysis_carterae.AAC.1